jgi:hypothetical protein
LDALTSPATYQVALPVGRRLDDHPKRQDAVVVVLEEIDVVVVLPVR